MCEDLLKRKCSCDGMFDFSSVLSTVSFTSGFLHRCLESINMQHCIFMILYFEVEPYMAGYSTVYFVTRMVLNSSSCLGGGSNRGKAVSYYLRTSNQVIQRVLQLA